MFDEWILMQEWLGGGVYFSYLWKYRDREQEQGPICGADHFDFSVLDVWAQGETMGWKRPEEGDVVWPSGLDWTPPKQQEMK